MNETDHWKQLRLHARYQMVALWETGWPVQEIALAYGCSINTVYRWIRRWKDDGHLFDRPRTGRPAAYHRWVDTLYFGLMTQPRRHLKVGAGVWVPWFDSHEHANGSVTYSGLVFDFFDIIAKKMNFTYSISTPADNEWARLLPNGSFTGIVGMCQRREVDMILGPVASTWDRNQAADFSVPIYTDYFKIFLPRPRLENDLSNITRPFAWKVWTAFAASLSLTIALALMINYFVHRKVVYGERTMDIDPAYFLRIVSTETIKTLPKTDSARIFLITWMIGGFILQSAYSGVLTSILAVPKVHIPVDSLEDLVNYNKIPWMLEKGIALHTRLAQAKSGIAKTVVDKASFVSYLYVARLRVRDEGMAVLADEFSMKSIMSDDFSQTGACNYYISREHVGQLLLSFGFPKGSDLIHHFNKWINILKESGIITHVLKSAATNVTACLAKPGKEKETSHLVFSIIDLAGMFLVLAAGAAAGFGALLVEHIMFRYKFLERLSK